MRYRFLLIFALFCAAAPTAARAQILLDPNLHGTLTTTTTYSYAFPLEEGCKPVIDEKVEKETALCPKISTGCHRIMVHVDGPNGGSYNWAFVDDQGNPILSSGPPYGYNMSGHPCSEFPNGSNGGAGD